MPWSGAGTYGLPAASFPEVNGTLIDATRYNATLNDIATGLSNALTKDGQNIPTANLPMGGFKHTGVVAGTVAGEYLVWDTAIRASNIESRGTNTTTGLNSGETFLKLFNTSATGFWAMAFLSDSVSPSTRGLFGLQRVGSINSFVWALDNGGGTLVERARLSTVGWGIGLTPSYPLEVLGTIASTTAGGIAPSIRLNQSGTAAWAFTNIAGSGTLILKDEGVGAERARWDSSGNFLPILQNSVPGLTIDNQLVMTLTTNTNLRISVRGSDGVTRVNNLTLT